MDFNQDWKQCANGHWFDPKVSATCPICASAGQGGAMEEYGATEPVGGGMGAGMGANAGGYGATEPVGAPGGFGGPVPDFDRTQPMGTNYNGAPVPNYDNFGATMPPSNGPMGGKVEDYGATEPIFANKTHGFEPVVGWIVCVEGADKGRDYKIHAGYNTIGRAQHMDICITGDVKISREKHALLAFDPDEKMFFFSPGDGKNLIRLNGKLVMMPSEIKSGDILTIGDSKFRFIPFVDDNFTWEESENK